MEINDNCQNRFYGRSFSDITGLIWLKIISSLLWVCRHVCAGSGGFHSVRRRPQKCSVCKAQISSVGRGGSYVQRLCPGCSESWRVAPGCMSGCCLLCLWARVSGKNKTSRSGAFRRLWAWQVEAYMCSVFFLFPNLFLCCFCVAPKNNPQVLFRVAGGC